MMCDSSFRRVGHRNLVVLVYIASAYPCALTRYAALGARAQRRVARTKQATNPLFYSLIIVLVRSPHCSLHRVNGVHAHSPVRRLREKLDFFGL